MRKVIEMQMTFGSVPIDEIKFDPRSRDEIPKLLRGLQSIYCNQVIRKAVFDVLEEMVPKSINPKNGRKGMDLWKIFIMGTMRLNCNWDYDKLLEMVNNHATLRQMLGHGIMDADYKYALQTLRDNVRLLTPEILDKINQIVVSHGHKIIGKKKMQN